MSRLSVQDVRSALAPLVAQGNPYAAAWLSKLETAPEPIAVVVELQEFMLRLVKR